MPVEQNSLDFPPRPDCSASEFGFIIGGEENAAPPHFPPLQELHPAQAHPGDAGCNPI
jgi:hypothetical protein